MRSDAPLPASVLRAFDVLRRPRRAHDGLPRHAYSSLSGQILRVVFSSSVRRVGRIAGGYPYFLVPALLHVRASRRCIARLPASRPARERRLARHARRVLVLCLINFENGGGAHCYAAAQAIAGLAVSWSESPLQSADPRSSELLVSLSALVPDNAASIEAFYPGEPPLQAPVTANFATFLHSVHVAPTAQALPNLNPTTVVLRRRDGRVLRTAHPPVEAPGSEE